MRQVGILAAAALVGTNEAVERLTLDHQHAQQLAQGTYTLLVSCEKVFYGLL